MSALTSLVQGSRFCMRAPTHGCPSAAHDHAIFYKDAPNTGVGIACGARATGKPRGRIQPAPITRRCRQPSNPPDIARGGGASASAASRAFSMAA